jgi:hypothetical protein
MKKQAQTMYRQPKPVPPQRLRDTHKRISRQLVSKSVVLAQQLKARWLAAQWHKA